MCDKENCINKKRGKEEIILCKIYEITINGKIPLGKNLEEEEIDIMNRLIDMGYLYRLEDGIFFTELGLEISKELFESD